MLNDPTKTIRAKRQVTPTKHRGKRPLLRFSPVAWTKLLFLRDLGETEVGGFGISSAADLLFVEDVELVGQTSSWAHVAFHDDAVADYFDRQVDLGRRVEDCGRIWIHTHPGDCPRPSVTDENTFRRVFGESDWAVMFILARGGATSARLSFNTGPRCQVAMGVTVDYSRPFPACDLEAWEKQYAECVRPDRSLMSAPRMPQRRAWPGVRVDTNNDLVRDLPF